MNFRIMIITERHYHSMSQMTVYRSIERKIVEAEFSLKLSIGSLVKLDKRFGLS